MAKKYLTLRFNLRGLPGAELAAKYKCGNCSVAIIDGDGEVLARFLDHPHGIDIGDNIAAIPEVAEGYEQLAKQKEKGITKANADSVAAALKKIGAMESKKATETILEYAKDDKQPESLQRGAILALAKQPEAAKELIPYLTDKRYPIKSAAQSTLPAMGLKGLPAVLEGLASDNVDVRAACFGPASTVTKNGKIAKDLTFWKSGKEDARTKALDEWKSWTETQLKPKPKDKKEDPKAKK